jgi:hypothetical protein
MIRSLCTCMEPASPRTTGARISEPNAPAQFFTTKARRKETRTRRKQQQQFCDPTPPCRPQGVVGGTHCVLSFVILSLPSCLRGEKLRRRLASSEILAHPARDCFGANPRNDSCRRTAVLLFPQDLQRGSADHVAAVCQTDHDRECYNAQGEPSHGYQRQ